MTNHIDLDAMYLERLSDTRQMLADGHIHAYRTNPREGEIYIQGEPGWPFNLSWSFDMIMGFHGPTETDLF
jgi:hypothetical protein